MPVGSESPATRQGDDEEQHAHADQLDPVAGRGATDSHVLFGQREGHEHPAGQLERFLRHAPAALRVLVERRPEGPLAEELGPDERDHRPEDQKQTMWSVEQVEAGLHDAARVAQHDGAGHQNEDHPAHGARKRMVCATVVELAEFRRREEHHEERIEAPSLRRLPR